MLLERQPGAGFDDDSLGLKWVTVVGRLIESRRAEHFGGADRRLVAALAQHIDHDRHVLRPLFMHQNRGFALIYDPSKRSDSPKE